MSLFVLHVILASAALLTTLNGYLRGAAKHKIDAVASFLLMAALVAIWWTKGWKAGLIAIPLAFVYAALARPFARAIAYRLMGYRMSMELAREHSSLESLVAGKLSLESYLKVAERRQEKDTARLNRLLGRPEIQRTLQISGKTRDHVCELIRLLSLTGAGTELIWDAVSDPKELAELLRMKENGASAIQLSAKVMRV